MQKTLAVGMRKAVGSCQIDVQVIGNKRIMKCKNLKRPPTAQEIIDSLKKL